MTTTHAHLGVYRAMSFDCYLGIDACSSSRLGYMVRRRDGTAGSPAYCRWMIDHAPPPTAAQLKGSVCHAAILEHDRFEEMYHVAGQCEADTKGGERCSKKGSVAFADGWFCGQHAKAMGVEHDDSRQVISADLFADAVAIRDAAYNHKPLWEFVFDRQAEREVSLLWRHEPTGLLCKGRPDLLAEGRLADVKITRSVGDDRRMERFVDDMGIHRKFALYLEGLQRLAVPVDGAPLLVCVHPEPPHEVALYEVDKEALRVGAEHVRKLRETYAECVKSGDWPGFAPEVRSVSVPIWTKAEQFPEEFEPVELTQGGKAL